MNKKTIYLVVSALLASVISVSAFAADEKKTKVQAPGLSPMTDAEIRAKLAGDRTASSEVKDAPSKEVSAQPVDPAKAFKASKDKSFPLVMPAMNAAPERSPFLDTKQTVYQYDPNMSYPVVTRPGMYTQIDLPDGFVVEGFYLSNTNEEDWKYSVSADGRHIFLQPSRGGLFNSGSIISGETSYLLAITSEDAGEWFQRVRWTMTKSQMIKYKPGYREALAKEEESVVSTKGNYENYAKSEDTVGVRKKSGPNPTTINTNWEVTGSAVFKPSSVYDDGHFTYIVFPKNLSEMPALFSIPKEGEPELVNYIVEGDEGNRIKVTRLLSGILLKLGKDEVKLKNLNTEKKFSFSSIFDSFSSKNVNSPSSNGTSNTVMAK